MKLEHLFNGASDMDAVRRFLRAGDDGATNPFYSRERYMCVSRYTGERRGEDFFVPQAFMHVAGKDRQLLPGSLPDETFLVQLEKGSEISDGYVQSVLKKRILQNLRGKTLFYVKSQGLFTNAWLWKNLTTVFLAVLFLVSLTWWFVFDARTRLKLRSSKRLSMSELTVGLTLALFLLWIALALVFKF